MSIKSSPTFVEKHGLWSEDQLRLAAELKDRIETEDLHLIRLAWVDSHGAVRAKEVSVRVFIKVLEGDGYNINVATSTLDAAGGRVFRSFTRGGGMGLDEMTGSPNLVIVPDPATFRVLPWAPGIGWILCDEYFKDGTPFHFSTRRILKNQLERLAVKGYRLIIGLEVEWYLTRIIEDQLSQVHVGQPGIHGRAVATCPVEPGYSYHCESHLDIMQPVLSDLARAYEALGMPLRSMEKEWGPGQIECTFSEQDALQAADDYVLMRSATRQICRRQGYLATFMCRPALKGYYASGWHLHQSLVDKESGVNLFTPDDKAKVLSELGEHWLAGLLHHAESNIVFATPTINGYRRFKSNSLAPDRVSWGIDHRGNMLRVLGGPENPATRLENRSGEPATNPYLFFASQIIAGMDGMEFELKPPPPETDPYSADNPMLPDNLSSALDSVAQCDLLRRQFGTIFMDYFVNLKQAELTRFKEYNENNNQQITEDDVTQWEQDEYFDFF
jgi:glutamine synthetase